MTRLRKKIFLFILVVAVVLIAGFGFYWVNTQPVGVTSFRVVTGDNIPLNNKLIIDYIEANGSALAPNYNSVVCTEFVIKVIEKFHHLSAQERRDIRIITDEDLNRLVAKESSTIKGVQHALSQSGAGMPLNAADVKPGDFVQFWNYFNGKAYGHCGVVMEMNPGKRLTVYSSHPLTNGYGKQTFLWPDKLFFVRLK